MATKFDGVIYNFNKIIWHLQESPLANTDRLQVGSLSRGCVYTADSVSLRPVYVHRSVCDNDGRL